jgi:hypothetical protein
MLPALLVIATSIGPVAAAPLPSAAPEPGVMETEWPATSPHAVILSAEDFAVELSQSSVSYDATTNRSQVSVSVIPSGAAAPWTWIVSVRGSVVASGSTSDAGVTAIITNACSITTMSVTTQVTDALGRSGSAASILDPSLCPPPPVHNYAGDRILARPTLNEASFVDRLRAADSPALPAGSAIYGRLVRAGVNPAFALGMFHAESHSGTLGYAVITKNWANILYYPWTKQYGATRYAPGNGYTYAKFPTWRAGVRAYTALLGRYWRHGYRSISTVSARWLGTHVGSKRHLRYLTNIVAAMGILPDDARPVMTRLAVPSSSPAPVTVAWRATDNRGVVGYQVRHRRGSHPWSARKDTTSRTTTLALAPGTWTIAVRAKDAAGNWSAWRKDTVRVTSGSG